MDVAARGEGRTSAETGIAARGRRTRCESWTSLLKTSPGPSDGFLQDGTVSSKLLIGSSFGNPPMACCR
jgi:hypothetical protein